MQQAAQRQAAAMHHMQQQQDHLSGKGPFRREVQPGGGSGDPMLMRQLTLEAQREFMVRRGGFSQNHPFVSGEVSVHPELQGGRLPFHVPPARYASSYYNFGTCCNCGLQASPFLWSMTSLHFLTSSSLLAWFCSLLLVHNTVHRPIISEPSLFDLKITGGFILNCG